MILTAAILLSLAIGSGAGLKFGYPRYAKQKDKKLFKQHFSLRPVFDEWEWTGCKQTILDECKGFYYSDSLINEIFEQGYRLDCKQIYELRDIYKERFSNIKDTVTYVNNLTHYEFTAKLDAHEKISNLLLGPKNILLLTHSKGPA